ncbi:MAG: HD domain-containing protein [Candidatus Pacebacteria bacterium]|nr:HD domain-containing protein [Candidatus Paceibacterota bacterium]
MDDDTRYADFLFEAGTMRKLLRMHRQTLLTDDMSDNIATHSYRVTLIGWILAKKEKVDPYKVVMMCLLHDMGEVRSNDHNWIHKRYVKVHDEEIINEQLGTLPDPELAEIAHEYDVRESAEAIIAKDADLLDQVLLLREYEWQGNKEATIWLRGKQGNEHQGQSAQLAKLRLESSKKLGATMLERAPSDWWNELWTSSNRTS